MSTCPFCSAEIDEGLSRFGGNCPHCFNVIPGEEAATDPGVPAVTPPVSEPESGSNKMVLVFAFLAVVAVGASFGLMGKEKESPEPTAPVEELDQTAQIEAEEQRVAEEAAVLEAEKAAAAAAELEAEEAAAEAAWRRQQKAKEEAERTQATSQASATTSSSSTSSSPVSSLSALPTGPTREVVEVVLSTPSDINRAVRNSLKRYKGQLNQCYDKQLVVEDSLQGTWQIAFTVEESGTTSGVVITPKSNSNPDFESCMLRQVSGWTFPRISAPHPYVKEYSFRP